MTLRDPFLAEIFCFSFDFAPKGWAQCNGQLLPIAQNQALFSLLGTDYGGDGRTTFALPDLRGRVPMHAGPSHFRSERGGESAHTLSLAELPQHVHPPAASSSDGDTNLPGGHLLAAASNVYGAPGAPATIQPGTVGNAGGSQPHENMQPYLVLNWCIALQGVFPSVN
jgi:microcystin-dependent protein